MTADKVANKSSNWLDSTMWTPSGVPTDGQSVDISGYTVTYDDDHSATGKNFTTGINGIIMNASSVLTFAVNGSVNLAMKTATNISGTGGVVNIGTVGAPVQQPTAVTQVLNGGAPSGQNVIPVASTTNFVVGATIYIVNGAESGTPATSLRETQTIASIQAGTSVTTSVNLTNSYTTVAGAYVTQLIIPRATLNFIGATSTAAITATGAHTVNGAYPSTPAAHPAYTMLHVDAAVGQGYVDLEDTDFTLQAGEQIMISAPSLTADISNNLYTVTKYEATGGADSHPRVHVYPVLATTARKGGHTGAENNDYVARYSRPILLNRAASSTTALLPTQTGGTFTGFRTSLTFITAANYNNTFNGITLQSGGTLSLGVNNSTFNGLVATSGNSSIQGSNNISSGCIAVTAILFADNNSVHTNAVIATGATSRYISSSGSEVVLVNPINRWGGCLTYSNIASITIVGARTVGTGCVDVNLSGSQPSGSVKLYNCTLGSQTVVANYTLTLRSVISTIQSYNQNGTPGYNLLWCRGGIGESRTDAPTTYNGFYTMKFTVDASVVAGTPLVWDMKFYMPKNKGITFTVPMYCDSTTGSGLSAAVWIVDPANDPLWFNPMTAPGTPTVGTAAGNVLAISAMPAPDSTWHNVQITVPAQTWERELIARVIFSGPNNKIGWAYLQNMENSLIKKRTVYL
jgi:hypothetical protein